MAGNFCKTLALCKSFRLLKQPEQTMRTNLRPLQAGQAIADN